jgi:tetratricopeptide (TPR) repeat protein
LDEAYAALRAKELGKASELFEQGLKERPDHRIARKDYAYTLLRLGETESARDQFGEAARQDSSDHLAGLEYGFLCHETGRRREALLVFDRLRKAAEGEQRETAEKAFRSIEEALTAGIAQWTEAARQNPSADSVHEELARLLEERGDFSDSEKHYLEALRLKPTKRAFLLDVGRARAAQGRQADADAAFLAASRSADIRLSERARESLAGRTLDADVIAASHALEPKMTFAVKRGTELSAIDMADRSLQLGYLNDALRYYTEANEAEPKNAQVQLQLGWVNNLLHRDKTAYDWFNKARKSDDPTIAGEARQAWRNLRDTQATMRPSIWMAPMFSSRWNAGFLYGQTKLEFQSRWGVRPYVSLRFTADTGAVNAPAPLSERAVTPAIGISTKVWHGMTTWAETGGNIGGIQGLDSRAGVFQSISRGQQLGGESSGQFWQAANSANYASRFGNDVIFSTQHRVGYTIGRFQAGVLFGAAADSLRQYWANYLEAGPTARIQLPWLPASVSVDFVRGRNYVVNGNPRHPNYWDFRVSLWYAFLY